jgi:antitoxin (DNA-binding transcriptional repressor) of toxin-antitoxin stability system
MFVCERPIKMKSISVLEFRKNAEKIIRWSRQGKRMIMTYRGRPVIRLEPILDDVVDKDDPFLQLDGIAVGGNENLSNQQMDEIIYGK